MWVLMVLLVWVGSEVMGQDGYKVKWGASGVIGFASVVDGVVEGYEFDGRLSFERKWGVDAFGFWGSKSWVRVQGKNWML